jgi:hypothetical protein
MTMITVRVRAEGNDMNKDKVYYIVTNVSRKQPVKVMNQHIDLELNWAKGMIGALPVFDDVQDAIAYASSDAQIFECVIAEQGE